MLERFPFSAGRKTLDAISYRPSRPLGLTLLFGPGHDGKQCNSVVEAHAQRLADRGVLVVTYDLPFGAAGHSKPDPLGDLVACCRAAVVAARQCRPHNRLFIGGKSLGARVAGHALADGGDAVLDVLGLVALGYPLHPVGAPSEIHEGHLKRLPVPAYFVQGTRDALGTADELRALVATLPAGEVCEVPTGDHQFAVSSRGGVSAEDVEGAVAEAIVLWMRTLAERAEGAAPRAATAAIPAPPR